MNYNCDGVSQPRAQEAVSRTAVLTVDTVGLVPQCFEQPTSRTYTTEYLA